MNALPAGASMASTDVSPAEWDAFVDGHSEATGYHAWRWRDVFKDVFGHECEYLAARRHGRVTGVLPLVFLKSWLFGHFGISLPFVNYGGVLADDQDAANSLLTAAARAAERRGASHVELRHTRRHFSALPVKQHKVTMLLTLTADAGTMWNGLDRKVRNQIRKAEKANLESVEGGAELLDEFYAVFTHNMRDLGIPGHSRRFFAAVLRCFPDQARVSIVRLDGQPIGGAISFRHRDVVEVPWASSAKKYLSLCPNNLLYWSIIQSAIARDARTLDFGRSTPDEGTFHFKRQWGAVPHPLYWEYQLLNGKALPQISPGNPKFKVAIDAWKHLPVPIASFIGPQLVRVMPY